MKIKAAASPRPFNRHTLSQSGMAMPAPPSKQIMIMEAVAVAD